MRTLAAKSKPLSTEQAPLVDGSPTLQGEIQVCVETNAKIGERYNLTGGRMGTLRAVIGPHTDCSTERPLGAILKID